MGLDKFYRFHLKITIAGSAFTYARVRGNRAWLEYSAISGYGNFDGLGSGVAGKAADTAPATHSFRTGELEKGHTDIDMGGRGRTSDLDGCESTPTAGDK